MNQGIEFADKENWILFWGSDDWAFENKTFENLNKKIIENSLNDFDMVICHGNYVNQKNKKLSRKTYFLNNKRDFIINKQQYRKLLLFGLTPPHQTTLINPKLFINGLIYDQDLKIAADIELFCKF